MKAGDVISAKNMKIIRPGGGLSPRYYDIFLGKKLLYNVKRGTGLDWNMI